MRVIPEQKGLESRMRGHRRMVEDPVMPSIWIVVVGVVAAINLWFIVPGLLAYLGIGKPTLSDS
jgi:hypothetical protein